MGKTYKDRRRAEPEPEPVARFKPKCGTTQKTCFHSEDAALARAAEILAAGARDADGFRAYKCPACGQFHLTKQTARPGIIWNNPKKP